MKKIFLVIAIVITCFFSCQQAAETVDKEALRKEIRAELEKEIKGVNNVQFIATSPVDTVDAKRLRKEFKKEFSSNNRIPNYISVDNIFINKLRKDSTITSFNVYPIKYDKDYNVNGKMFKKGNIGFMFVVKRAGFSISKLTRNDIDDYNDPCFPNTVPICSDDF